MSCDCDTVPVAFPVPAELSHCAPGAADGATICPDCLTTQPASSAPEEPDFSPLGTGYPQGAAGPPMALAIGLLDSLAGNRRELEDALEYAERTGADPLLVIDRLLADPTIEPAIDLERRRSQLESLLY